MLDVELPPELYVGTLFFIFKDGTSMQENGSSLKKASDCSLHIRHALNISNTYEFMPELVTKYYCTDFYCN